MSHKQITEFLKVNNFRSVVDIAEEINSWTELFNWNRPVNDYSSWQFIQLKLNMESAKDEPQEEENFVQNEQYQQRYIADQIPPDWGLAAAHAQAVRPGRQRPGAIQACPCCFAYIDKEPIGYNQNVKELAFLGEGFPLFINFMKYCVVMLLVLLIDDGIVGIVLSASQNHCNQVMSPSHRLLASDNTTSHSTTACQNNYANANAYISDSQTPARRAIKFTSFIAQLLLLIYFRDQQNKLASYLDQRTTTMSDYSVRLFNVPTGENDNKDRITRLMKECDPSFQIMDILLIENAMEYQREEKVLAEIVKEQKKAHKAENSQEIVELNKKYVKQKKKIDKLGKMMKNNQKQYFIGEAFIVMNTEEQKDRAIELLNELSADKVKQEYPDYDGSTKILAVQAPEPKEIIWENIHYSSRQRFGATLLGWFLAILTIVAITIAFFFLIKFKGSLIEQAHLHYVQDPQKYGHEYTQGVILGYIIVILIVLFNKFIISVATHSLTNIERHNSRWAYNFSYAMKYTLSMFFTTALMTLMVEAIIYANYTGSLGVIEEETFMFIFNAYFSPIIWLINPYNITAWIRRKIYYGSQYLTQAEANHIMELPEYNMGKRYAEVIKTIWFTFLYVQIIPIGTVYSLTGMILYYAVDKYVLLYRCSVKDSISSSLSRTMITVLEFTLVLKPAGQMLFDSQLRHTFSIDSLAMLCVGVFYMLLPVNRILNFVNPENFNPEPKTYESVRHMFAETYFTLYPIKRNELTFKYLSKESITFVSQISSPLKTKNGNFISEKNLMTQENDQPSTNQLEFKRSKKVHNANEQVDVELNNIETAQLPRQKKSKSTQPILEPISK